MTGVLVALITSGFAYLIERERRNTKKIDEMHQQWTVNHHSSADPTVKDFLTDIRDEQRHLTERFDDHIEWHLNNKR